ncbi:Mss4-like protein [Pestalotiopsis sp. NC0098]|nr:Mss4-like protein [Pestalotiopsis sp. NC0098]
MAPDPLPTFATKENPRTGSCLCGAVQLKITGTPVFTNLCHCIDCQKATASLFIACATFKSEDLEYTCTPADAMKEFKCHTALSGNLLLRHFCQNCGSTVKNEAARLQGAFIAVPIGIIDDDKSDLKPRYELFCSNREAWLGNNEGVVQAPGMPPPDAFKP